jgi:hypothetical protein
VKRLAILGAAAALAGCGLGAGSGVRSVSVTVSDDYGARTVGSARVGKTPGGETVMRFLQRRFDVRTRYGGGFVQAIDGLSGGARGGRVDWFYYVNGVEAPRGAAATRLHPGDRVWWDRHTWSTAASIPAVVGSFPEPFRSGVDGKRLPVRVVCVPGRSPGCNEAERRLGAVGVPFGQGSVAPPPGKTSLRLLVGPWSRLRADPLARRIEGGPGQSGVFASFDPSGRGLRALDADGRPRLTLGAGAGLVAATRQHDQQPTWVVTGTDAAGVLAAARALDQRTLANRFALVLAGSRQVPVPVTAR